MKRRDIKTLHAKSTVELQQLLIDKQKELIQVKLERKVKKDKNTRRAFMLQDDIARIKTVIKELEIKERGKT